MERTSRAQVWAGVAMLTLCLLVGAVEGRQVVATVSWLPLVVWGAAYLAFLVGAVAVAWQPVLAGARALLLGLPVAGAAVVVLLPPHRAGLALILLVLAAALVALHAGPRTTTLVILVNSVVVAADAAGLGLPGAASASAGEVVLTTVLYALLQAGSAMMVWSQRRVEEALEEVSVAHVGLRSASVLLAESSQAQERLRISRELHDVLGHQLTVLSVELEVASHLAEGEGREHVLRARGLTKDLLADVRSVVGVERDRTLDLSAALARVVEGVPSPRVHLEVGADVEVDGERTEALVRAVQEITTNTIRHAHADHLWLTVAADGPVVRLTAHDDGVGTRGAPPGNGLRGLRERVEGLGGSVHLDGGPGCRVTVELPVRQRVGAP